MPPSARLPSDHRVDKTPRSASPLHGRSDRRKLTRSGGVTTRNAETHQPETIDSRAINRGKTGKTALTERSDPTDLTELTDLTEISGTRAPATGQRATHATRGTGRPALRRCGTHHRQGIGRTSPRPKVIGKTLVSRPTFDPPQAPATGTMSVAPPSSAPWPGPWSERTTPTRAAIRHRSTLRTTVTAPVWLTANGRPAIHRAACGCPSA